MAKLMFSSKIFSFVLIFAGQFGLYTVKGLHQTCVLDRRDMFSRPCGYCGVCKTTSKSGNSGICDNHYLESSGLFQDTHSSRRCLLKNYCENYDDLCRNDSLRFTGVCFPLFGTYRCECKQGFYGKDCENADDLELSYRTVNKIQKSTNQHAVVHNVVFTPIFYCQDFATIMISLQRTGYNLNVYIDNGREKLRYNKKKCKRKLSTNKFCKDLFINDVENIRICEGKYLQTGSELRNSRCLMIMKVPFPRAYDKSKVIYQYIDEVVSSDTPVLGNLETVTVGINNDFGESARSKAFEYTFEIINIHGTSDPRTHCAPKVQLVNCGATMENMPSISRSTDLVILSSVTIKNPGLVCQEFDKFNYFWKVWRIQDNHDELKNIPVLKMSDTETYKPNERMMDYGVYKVKLTVISNLLDYIVSEKAYCYFKVIRTPIQTTIIGGSLRTMFYGKPITFDVFSSVVPDRYSLENGMEVLYEWHCNDLHEQFCKPYSTADITRKITGPFQGSQTYTFTVKTKVTQQFQVVTEHAEMQVIKVTSSTVLNLGIICLKNCGGSVFKSNPQEVILLEVTSRLSMSENVTLQWTYKCIEEGDDFQDVNTIQDKDSTQFRLLIEKNKLKEGRKYVFLVALVGSVSTTEIVIETDEPPKGVVCEIFPKNGTKGETLFSVSCKSPVKEGRYPTLTYEFFDRYEHENIGRMVGYSATGELTKIMLTRDRFFARATSFFGTITENLVRVELSSPITKFSPSLIMESKNELENKDYIYRLGIISAYSDLLGSQLFWSEEIQILLNLLTDEEATPQDIMGALLLKNSLSITACDRFVAIIGETTILQCKSILSLAEVMNHVTDMLQTSLLRNNTNSRILTTNRTKIFVDSILRCSNFVLEANFLTEHELNDVDVHECLKESTYRTIVTLDNLVYIIALQVPLIKKQKFKSENIALFVEEMGPNIDVLSLKTVYLTELSLQEGYRYYIQQIIFSRNPFWWGSGNKINTNVYSFHVNSGSQHIKDPDIRRIVHFDLKVATFQLLLIQGSVKQPDPIKCAQVNDLEVVVYKIDPETYSDTFIEFVNFTGNADVKVLLLQNERPDFDLMTTRATEVTHLTRKLSFALKGKQDNVTFYYLGILPGPQVNVGVSVNYSFTVFSARCAVWKYKSWISGERCAVNKTSDMNRQLLICSCSMLTLTIGGYVYNPIVTLNPFSDVSLCLNISENTLIILLLLITFLFFLIVLIWTRKKDKEDTKRKSVLVLEDNGINDSYLYLIAVFTGSRFGAGTTSNVGIKLFGKMANSRTRVFMSRQQRILQCGGDDWFLLSTPQHLGSILQIKLLIDYSGLFPNWFCRKVIVCDLKNSETVTFLVEKWFGINKNGVCMETVTKSARSHNVNSFRLIFFHNLIQGLRELHIYVSIFFKHPRSLITRTQRLTVALCCVLAAMLTTTLLYSLSTPIFEDYAFFDIKSKTIMVIFVSSLVATVVGLITMHYFRKTYTIVGDKFLARSDISLNKNNKSEKRRKSCLELFNKCIEKYVSSCKTIPIGNIDNTKSLEENNSVRILAWMICLAVIFVSLYTIIMSSLTYGEIKRSLWVTSLVFTGLIGFFVLIPIKVLLTAVFLGLLKIRYFDLMSHNITVNSFIKYVTTAEKHSDMYEKHRSTPKVLFDSYISWQKQCYERVKRTHHKKIRIWIYAYISEAVILILVIWWAMAEFETYKIFYSNTAVCSEMLSDQICDNVYDIDISFILLRFHVHEFMLPKLYNTVWYNGEAISFRGELYQETGWMMDANSRLIGDPHLLQVRVQKNLCSIPQIMINFTKTCLPSLSSSTVDRDNYSLSWTHDDWTEIELFSESPWQFVQGSGIGVRTPSDYYLKEGGYIAALLRSLSAAKLVYTNLIDTNWIDDQTRVIVLEFVTYNVNTNMVTSSYFVTEMFPTSFMKVSYTIRSKSHYFDKFSVQSKLFIFVSLYFSIRMLVLINVMGVGNFFGSFWDCYDLCFSIMYTVATVKHIYWLQLLGTEEVKTESMVKNRHVYLEVLFQAQQDSIIYICFTFGLGAFRMIRVANINDSCKKYLRDFIETRNELLLTVFLSLSSMYVMFRLVMYYLEPPTVYDFMDILVFQSDFQSLQSQYDDLTGKLSAFILNCFSSVTMFSFTISLVHHQRQVTIRRLSLIETP